MSLSTTTTTMASAIRRCAMDRTQEAALALYTCARRHGFPRGAIGHIVRTTPELGCLLQLCASPSPQGWRVLWDHLQTRDVTPELLDTLQHALSHWPDALRELAVTARVDGGEPRALQLVRRVVLRSPAWQVLDWPGASEVRELVLDRQTLDDRWLERLATSAFAARLETLVLEGVWRRTGTGVRLARGALPALRRVVFERPCEGSIVVELVRALTSGGQLQSFGMTLRTTSDSLLEGLATVARELESVPELDLDLLVIPLGALLRLELAGLKRPRDRVDLSHGFAPSADLGALPYLRTVRHTRQLDLGTNHIDVEGLRRLLSGPPLERLERLSLVNNRLGDAAVELLAARLARQCPNLRELDLRGNHLGPRSLDAFVSAEGFAHLRHVALGESEPTRAQLVVWQARRGAVWQLRPRGEAAPSQALLRRWRVLRRSRCALSVAERLGFAATLDAASGVARG